MRFEPMSEHIISVQLSTEMDGPREQMFKDISDNRKLKAVQYLILNYTEKGPKIPDYYAAKIHLISPLNTCNICGCQKLVLTKPTRQGRGAVVYTEIGGLEANHYIKHCSNQSCLAVLHSSYTEYTDVGGQTIRKYLLAQDILFYAATDETFFCTQYLKCVTEDIFTCSSNFTSITEKFNILHSSKIQLNKKRLEYAWILYAVNQIFTIDFPVTRDSHGSMDLDRVCEYLYPKLKSEVDPIWLAHICAGCSKRGVIMDGNAKCYRDVCSVRGEKITNYGELTEFTACCRSPMGLKGIFCKEHVNGKTADSGLRLDQGCMTRKRCKELGLDIETLTSKHGCRKELNITKRTEKSKTAGMLFAYRYN